MAVSNTLRNRLVGFGIVASSILIILPLILSKDMITKRTPDAIAVNGNGAIVNEKGELAYKDQADLNLALNVNSDRGTLQLAGEQKNPAPDLNDGPVTAGQDNGVEMLEFSRPETSPSGEILTSNRAPAAAPSGQAVQSGGTEILTPSKPAQNAQTAQSQRPQGNSHEVLVSDRNPPKKEVKPAPAPAPAKPSPGPGSNDEEIIAGSRPGERFVIQVGVFSKKDNAMKVVKILQGDGIPAYAVRVNTNGRELFRVFGGRSNNRNDLNTLVERVNRLCGTKSKIVPN